MSDGYGRKHAGQRRKYTGDFKLSVILDLRNNDLSYNEVGRKYEISHTVIMKWERIYLEEGSQALYIERRGKAKGGEGNRLGSPPKLEKKVEEDLIAENQRLRMENAYLKKLNALVQDREKSEKKTKLK